MVDPPPENPSLSKADRDAVVLISDKRRLHDRLEYLQLINGELVAKFSQVNSIDAALRIVGFSLYAEGGDLANDRTDAAGFPAGADLSATAEAVVGFNVRDLQGTRWGVITAVDTRSANVLLEIENPEKSGPIYVPFNREIVRNIDRRKRAIVIDPPPGLKDLNP